MKLSRRRALVPWVLVSPGLLWLIVFYAIPALNQAWVSLLSGSLRAGYSLLQGVEAVSKEVNDPMGQELRRVITEARLGREIEDAMDAVAERMGSADFAWAVKEAAEIMVRLFNPMMPHLAEECWAMLGHKALAATEAWPKVEAELLVENTITLPIQINGKKKADITVARDAKASEIEAAVLALDDRRGAGALS